MTAALCRICRSTANLFLRASRTFHICPACALIFTDDIPAKSIEVAHYKAQWQQPDPEFWKGQADVLLSVVEKYRRPEHILDFGSGRGDLARELERRGLRTTPVEPMVHGHLKDQRYPQPFDVIFATEVIEHLADVWTELRQLERVLAPGGIIVFSTLLTNTFINRPDAAEFFAGWWYKDDPTHLNFFSNRTLGKIAEMGPYDIDILGEKIFVLRKLGNG
jgi:SAM-dependent methyltransferase